MTALLQLWASGQITKAEYDRLLAQWENQQVEERWQRVRRKDGRWVWVPR